LRKTGYRNFIGVLRILYKARHRVGRVKLEKARNEIDEEKPFADKQWLLEKIAELEKRRWL